MVCADIHEMCRRCRLHPTECQGASLKNPPPYEGRCDSFEPKQKETTDEKETN